jgi:hypothetical protein
MAVFAGIPDCKSGIRAGKLGCFIRFLFAIKRFGEVGPKAVKVQGFATLG